MSAHTPGPWTLVDATGEDLAITTEGRMADDIVPIVEVDIDWDEPLASEQYANAKLIAAAPKLLEALQAVVKVADRKTDEFDLAHAAIAAATS